MIEKRILMIDNTSKMNSLKNKNVDEKISILKETIYPKKNKKISNSLKILPSSKKYIKGSLK